MNERIAIIKEIEMEKVEVEEKIEETKEISPEQKQLNQNEQAVDEAEAPVAPKPTLYVRNLNDKIKTAGKHCSHA